MQKKKQAKYVVHKMDFGVDDSFPDFRFHPLTTGSLFELLC